ncbi:MAG: hypothetical protein ACON4J_04125 [Parvibaculales bacterium]
MIRVNQALLEQYMECDVVQDHLDNIKNPSELGLTCNQWLANTPPKRAIFHRMYDFCFKSVEPLKILDVGGGVSSFTPLMQAKHDYTLCDLMAHDDLEGAQKALGLSDLNFLKACDWLDLADDEYDLVIANDLFPNVDQRLEMFLDKFLPQTKKISLSLTVYDQPKFYLTQRVGVEEHLTVLAWNSDFLTRVLEKYMDRIIEPNFTIFKEKSISLYPNGRHVYLCEFLGDL